MSKQKSRRIRNERRWHENDDLCVIDDHPNGPTLVRITGMQGDNRDGEVIYTVCEVASKQCYPASDKHLRAAKDRAEVDRFLKGV